MSPAEMYPCRIGTRRMLEILEKIVAGEGEMEDLDRLEELANMIRSMALCGLGKSAPLPVISTLKTFRDEYVQHIVRQEMSGKSLSGYAPLRHQSGVLQGLWQMCEELSGGRNHRCPQGMLSY